MGVKKVKQVGKAKWKNSVNNLKGCKNYFTWDWHLYFDQW